jgi:hypothetical protein
MELSAHESSAIDTSAFVVNSSTQSYSAAFEIRGWLPAMPFRPLYSTNHARDVSDQIPRFHFRFGVPCCIITRPISPAPTSPTSVAAIPNSPASNLAPWFTQPLSTGTEVAVRRRHAHRVGPFQELHQDPRVALAWDPGERRALEPCACALPAHLGQQQTRTVWHVPPRRVAPAW